VIPLTRAIHERIRGGLRRCAIQIDVYFTLYVYLLRITSGMPTLEDIMRNKRIECVAARPVTCHVWTTTENIDVNPKSLVDSRTTMSRSFVTEDRRPRGTETR